MQSSTGKLILIDNNRLVKAIDVASRPTYPLLH